MKLKNILLSGLSLVLVAALAIGGTVAYLQDDDSDVNVMTLGNVSIAQHEYERAVDADGNYKTITVTKADGSTQESYELTEFKQAKPLLPGVGAVTNYDPTYVRFEQLGDPAKVQGGQAPLYGMNNVQDKFVLVENTGKTDAYVRTIIAFEAGAKTYAEWDAVIRTSTGDDGEPWEYNWISETVNIEGNNYVICEAIYTGYSYGNMRHNGGILPAGEWTYSNLAQVYMMPTATNEDCEALDGNGNGTYDILVLSQAVQAAGFENAATALDTAFGKSAEKAAEWFGGVTIASEVGITEGGTYDLKGDVYTIDSAYFHTQKVTDAPVTINGNGATVEGIATSADAFQWEGGTIPAMSAIFSSADGSKVTVNDLKFTGTMSAIMLGHYQNANYNNYNTEMNNVDVIDTKVVSFSANIAPAVCVYGTATLNNCNVYGTTLSELEEAPKWPVYDVAAVNYSDLTVNDSKIGSIFMWNQAKVTIADGTEVDTIVVRGNMNTSKYGLTVKAGATVGAIDLSALTNKTRINITIKDGATVGKIIANGVEYATIADWQNAQ